MITKRILGIGFTAVGFLAIVGSFLLDLLEAGEYDGIGPTQLLGIKIATAVVIFGLTLIPFGEQPA